MKFNKEQVKKHMKSYKVTMQNNFYEVPIEFDTLLQELLDNATNFLKMHNEDPSKYPLEEWAMEKIKFFKKDMFLPIINNPF